MAHLHPIATMCEVTYDSDWYEDDRYMTPYRYSLLRNDTDSNSDTVSLTLPSYSYYEYLRSLYDCRTTALHRNPPGYPSSPGSDRFPERAKTWHEFGSERTSVQAGREAAHSEPTKIRPTYPFPSLHLIQQGAASGDESEEEEVLDRSKEKLVWVDALNRWIPEQQLHPRPYISFVGNPPVIEKQSPPKSSRESQRRWQSAPNSRSRVSFMPLAYAKELSFCSVTNEKRDEIRRRAQEIAEQRRQRKAYSTPLYTSMTERHQNARLKSFKAASTPVSPVQKIVKALPPKEVWQPRDTPKICVEENPAPLKREISLTLTKNEDAVGNASGDSRFTTKDKGDKHVKFLEEQARKAAENKNANQITDGEEKARLDAAAAEKKLVEALEKQRQQQLAEQQRLLQEEQKEKERLARERELQAERERLEKEKERLLELEKDPKKHGLMNSHKQPHENYYESTMNAADAMKERSGAVIRNRNLNRGVLKAKETVKNSVPSNNKIEKRHKNIENLARTNRTVVNTVDSQKVDSQKPVSGRSNNVPSKENKIKKELVNKPKELENVEKEVVVENNKPVFHHRLKENNLIDNGGKRRKGKGEGTKTQKKKTTKEKLKKKTEEEKEEKHRITISLLDIHPSDTPKQMELLSEPNPIIPDSSEQIQTKSREKKVKLGQKRVKGQLKPKPRPASSPAIQPHLPEEQLQVSSAEDLIEPSVQQPVAQLIQQVVQQPPERDIKEEHPNEKRKFASQRVITLKEKKERPCVKKEAKEKEDTLPPPPEFKKADNWIFDDEDFSQDIETKTEEKVETVVPSETDNLIPEIVEEEKKETKEKHRKSLVDHKIKTGNKSKKWRKPSKLDTSYDDELWRLELAEKRRKRQMEMLERIKKRQMENLDGKVDDGSPHFEDYGFLSKYCIFTKGNIEMYRHAFDAVDDEHRGWLEGEDVMIALRGVNSKLTEAEEEYMYRILELTGYRLTNGADFKMFSVLAALSQRISALDAWMKNLIGSMDFKMLDMKLFMCKTLWECNVDPDTNRISLDQLCVDLRAGGVSLEHEFEVREKLSHLDALDLLDFLTYVPLFIMIHQSVVKNPLDDTREK